MSFHDSAPEFKGEVPLPERIDTAKAGISQYPANADHGHPLLVDPFVAFTMINGWANIGGGYRSAGIIKVGNVVFLRGVINNGPAGNSIISSAIDSSMWPSEQEILYMSANGRVDMAANGNLLAWAFVAGQFLVLNNMWVVG